MRLSGVNTWELCCAVVMGVTLCSPLSAGGAPSYYGFVPSAGNGTVSVVDTSTNSVVASIPVGSAPLAAAIHPAGGPVFVANYGSNSVSIIDAASALVIDTVSLQYPPYSLALNPSGTQVYVISLEGRNVSVIDLATHAVVATISLGIQPPSEGDSGPRALAFAPSGAHAYVASDNGTVSVIDTVTYALTGVIGLGATAGMNCTFGTGTCPRGIAVHPSGQFAYVTRLEGPGTGGTGSAQRNAFLSVLDLATNSESAVIRLGGLNPHGIAISASGNLAFVALAESDRVAVVDLGAQSVVATLPVGSFPRGVARHPAADRVYVANQNSASVSVIDSVARTVVATVGVGPSPVALGQWVGAVIPPNQPPRCGLAQAVPAILWPPDHRLVPIAIVGVSDPDNDSLAISITSVTQDEPVNGLGDGDTSPDAVVVNGALLVRAERAGSGNGRVYRVAFTAGDGRGGTCTGRVTVSVPHSRKPGDNAADDGVIYDSMAL